MVVDQLENRILEYKSSPIETNNCGELLNDNNIIKGYDENTFGPNDNLTRAQMVVWKIVM